MNKYRGASRRAQRARVKARMCTNKRRYPTKDAAYQKGNEVYVCPICRGWHRTGSLATLVSKVNNANRR